MISLRKETITYQKRFIHLGLFQIVLRKVNYPSEGCWVEFGFGKKDGRRDDALGMGWREKKVGFGTSGRD